MARSKSRSNRPIQIVWPRDRRANGSKKRTFFQGLHDILTSRGPDMFVTRRHDKTPINPEMWGNWDGYHSPEQAALDRLYSYKGPLCNADRGRRNLRYDPQSRKYVEWEYENNWYGQGPVLPQLTRKEHESLSRHHRRRVEGKDYGAGTLKRSNPEHQPFWHRARRIADNRLAGYMEETDNLRADAHYLSFIDRARDTPGLSRHHTIGLASQGRPDHYLGGPVARRHFGTILAGYDRGRDNRGWAVPNQSWEEGDGGGYWDPLDVGSGEFLW